MIFLSSYYKHAEFSIMELARNRETDSKPIEETGIHRLRSLTHPTHIRSREQKRSCERKFVNKCKCILSSCALGPGPVTALVLLSQDIRFKFQSCT